MREYEYVLRGGSWYNAPGYLHTAYLGGNDHWNSNVGFRVVCDLVLKNRKEEAGSTNKNLNKESLEYQETSGN